jgi:hypothetical protein
VFWVQETTTLEVIHIVMTISFWTRGKSGQFETNTTEQALGNGHGFRVSS